MICLRSKLFLILMLLIPSQLVISKCPNKLAANCPLPKTCKKKRNIKRFVRVNTCCLNTKRLKGLCGRLKRLIAFNGVINNNLVVRKNLRVRKKLLARRIVANNVGKNYLNAKKMSNQTLSTSYANITGFSTTSCPVNGWTFNGSDVFTTPKPGVYKIEYVAHANGTGVASLIDIGIRVNVNGTLISQSPSVTSDLLTITGTNTVTIAGSFLVRLTAGDNISLQASTSALLGNPQLASVTVNGTQSPAVSLVITQVA